MKALERESGLFTERYMQMLMNQERLAELGADAPIPLINGLLRERSSLSMAEEKLQEGFKKISE